MKRNKFHKYANFLNLVSKLYLKKEKDENIYQSLSKASKYEMKMRAYYFNTTDNG